MHKPSPIFRAVIWDLHQAWPDAQGVFRGGWKKLRGRLAAHKAADEEINAPYDVSATKVG